jgi:hypothetical protein
LFHVSQNLYFLDRKPTKIKYTQVMANPRTGYYQCPRCNGHEAYESEETTGAMATTLNTDGPVDPTIIRTTTGIVMRCKDCGEQVKWFDSVETLAYKYKRDTNWTAWIGTPSGILMVILGIWALTSGLPFGTGEIVFFWIIIVLGALFTLGGIATFQEIMAAKKLEKK